MPRKRIWDLLWTILLTARLRSRGGEVVIVCDIRLIMNIINSSLPMLRKGCMVVVVMMIVTSIPNGLYEDFLLVE